MISITGATGFVGRQIVKALYEAGAPIRAIVQNSQHIPETLKTQCLEIVKTPDVFNESRENLGDLLKNSTVLIHAAWYAEQGKYLTSPINFDCLRGTIELARAFAEVGGRRFVGVGTCAEYDLSSGVLSTETPLLPTTLYAACKTSVYQILSNYFPDEDVSFAWCRLFYLYGEGEDPRRLVPYIRQKLEAGEPAELTEGEQIRDYLDVLEAGAMIAKTALGNTQGAVNICSGVATTVRHLAEQIADEYGRRDLLHFGARKKNAFDPPCIIGKK